MSKPVNVKLLEKVKAAILEEPKRLDMTSWGYHLEGDETAPACGTVACIAGWAVAIASLGRKKITAKAIQDAGIIDTLKNTCVEEEAERLIGGDSPRSLFFPDLWPPGLSNAYGETFRIPNFVKQQKARTKIAARAIDAYIKENA